MIQIKGTQTIAEVEKLFDRLSASGEDEDLLLPGELRGWRCGGTPSLIQFILTWAFQNKEASLRLHYDDEKFVKKGIADLARKFHGYVALAVSKKVIGINGKDLNLIVKNALIEESQRRWSDEKANYRGPGLFYVCVDDPPFNVFSLPFYDPNENVVSSKTVENYFKLNLIPYLFKHFKQDPRVLNDLQVQIISRAVWELFKNTHDWARNDSIGKIEKSVRGIFVYFHSSNKEQKNDFSLLAKDSKPYQIYFENLKLKESDQFLEVAIFDSGMGLAQVLSKMKLSEGRFLQEEYKYVLKCFEKHSTSSGIVNRGLGLFDVMRFLTQTRGFLRVRTGSLSLYRDFSVDPLTDKEEEKFRIKGLEDDFGPCFLRDWLTQDVIPTARPWARGLLIDMIFPVSRPIKP